MKRGRKSPGKVAVSGETRHLQPLSKSAPGEGDSYAVVDLAVVFGEHRSRIEGWVRRGLLGLPKERVNGRDVHLFLRKHAREYDLRRVDQVWYKAMLFGRLAGRGGQT